MVAFDHSDQQQQYNMFSRAHLLIEREIEQLISSPPWGVSIEQVDPDSVFHWMAHIHGLRGTIWEGGVFQVLVQFDEHYNIRPPSVLFQTVPFHPNIDMKTGRPCVDFLDDFDLWNPSYSLSMILVTLQMLLSNPNLKQICNVKAEAMLKKMPHIYDQIALECVDNSKHIQDIRVRPSSVPESKVQFAAHEKPASAKPVRKSGAPARAARLSFDDYLETWKNIATSKPNTTLEACVSKYVVAYASRDDRTGAMKDFKETYQGYREILHGRFGESFNEEKELTAKLERLQQMRRIYLRANPPPQSPMPNRKLSDAASRESRRPYQSSPHPDHQSRETTPTPRGKNQDDASKEERSPTPSRHSRSSILKDTKSPTPRQSRSSISKDTSSPTLSRHSRSGSLKDMSSPTLSRHSRSGIVKDMSSPTPSWQTPSGILKDSRSQTPTSRQDLKSPRNVNFSHGMTEADVDDLETEAEDLLHWSNKLDDSALDT